MRWITFTATAALALTAQIARADLSYQDRRIYVELSNEVWNDGFKQSQWAQARGNTEKLSANGYEARARAYSERVVEVMSVTC